MIYNDHNKVIITLNNEHNNGSKINTNNINIYKTNIKII